MPRFTRTTPRSRRTLRAAAALAAGAALVLSGCSADHGSASAGEGLAVVATTTQLADFAREIGGDDVQVRRLLTPGGSAHHFDPTPADLLALSEADVLIVNGAGLETFIDDAIEASGFTGEIITAADGIDIDEATEITAEGEAEAASGVQPAHDHAAHDHADHDHAAEDHAAEDHADHDHAAEDHASDEPAGHDGAADEHADHDHAEETHDHGSDDHAGHDHGPTNPHLWTSPRYAADMARHIGAELARIDQADAADIDARTAAYTERLEALDAWAAEQFAAVPEASRVLVSGHDSLRYYLHDYGIAFAGAILPSFEDNAEPSAADIDALVAAIQERGVTAVFVESSMSPKLARTIAKEAGVQVIDAESLYADSLGPEDSDGATYIGATVHNTRLILEAWGQEAGELPAALQS